MGTIVDFTKKAFCIISIKNPPDYSEGFLCIFFNLLQLTNFSLQKSIYFFLKNILTGTPVNLKFNLN